MKRILNFLLGRAPQFYPFEALIIEAVKSRLSTKSANRLQSQVQAINKIQRLSEGKEVNLYCMRHGKAAFDDNLRFLNVDDEALLASVVLSQIGKKSNMKAEVWLAKGRLFSLVFNLNPKRFFTEVDIKSAQAEIEDIKIWLDPMQPHTPSENKSVDSSSLTGWLREWYARDIVSNLRAPLSQSKRAVCLERVNAQLPQDYLELIDQTEGAQISTILVYGASEVRKVVCSDANYYMLAELEERGALLVKDGGINGDLYFADYEDDNIQLIGKSMQSAIEYLMDNPAKHVR